MLTSYTITPVAVGLIPTALNNDGQVVGYMYNASTQTDSSFLWSNGTLTALTGVGTNAIATGINDSDQVVGSSNSGPFLLNFNTGAVTSLPLDPTAINDAGQIAGNGNGAEVDENGTVITLDPGASYSFAEAISGNGLVAGYAPGNSSIAGDADPWVWNPANGKVTATDLGGGGAEAFGVNNSGQATGFDGLDNANFQAFFYSNGVFQDIGTLGGAGDQSQGNAINNSGVVVGQDSDVGAFVYSNGAMANLNSLVPAGSGFTLNNAVAINNNGQILVQATDASGSQHAVLLNPVATPSLAVTAIPSTATAGMPFSFTVTALNTNGTVDTGFTDTVHFSSNSEGVLPANYTFTTNDKGAHTFTATMDTAGTQTLTVSDTTNPGVNSAQQGITVQGGAATKLLVSSPTFVTAGATFQMSVTAYDAFDNVATGYQGTVHFADSASGATLPANYTFTTADGGEHIFSGLKLTKKGEQTITVTDTHTATIKGSIPIDVYSPGGGFAAIATGGPAVGIGIIGSDGDAGSWWGSAPTRRSSLGPGLS